MVYSFKKVAVRTLLKVAVYSTLVGLPWEYLAVEVLHIWQFNAQSTSPFWIGNWIPLEEILFYPWIGIAVAGVAAFSKKNEKAEAVKLGRFEGEGRINGRESR